MFSTLRSVAAAITGVRRAPPEPSPQAIILATEEFAKSPIVLECVALCCFKYKLDSAAREQLDGNTPLGDYTNLRFSQNFLGGAAHGFPRHELLTSARKLLAVGALIEHNNEEFELTRLGALALKNCLPSVGNLKSFTLVGEFFSDFHMMSDDHDLNVHRRNIAAMMLHCSDEKLAPMRAPL